MPYVGFVAARLPCTWKALDSVPLAAQNNLKMPNKTVLELPIK